ncbi:hypothetical protein SLE2022_403820 [Rubroshorea leprosula]
MTGQVRTTELDPESLNSKGARARDLDSSSWNRGKQKRMPCVLFKLGLFPRVGLLDVISVSGADSDPSGLHAIGKAGSLVASDLSRA